MSADGARALAPIESDAAPIPAGIHRIALPTPFPIGRVNAYLLEGTPLTLVDTGVNTGTALVALEAALSNLGYRLEDLELLVISHGHVDHLGLAPIIAQRAGCPIAAYAELKPVFAPENRPSDIFRAHISWATGQLGRDGYPHELALGSRSVLEIAQALGSWPTIDVALHPGATITAGSRDWEILYRPGHSLSDLVLVDRADGTALSADHLLASTSPNPTLSTALSVLVPTAQTERVASLPLYLESLQQTTTDELQLMLPGHGPTIGAPEELIATRIAFHARRAERMLGLLGTEPTTVYEVASQLWRGVPILQPHLTHSEVRGHLDMLLADGRAHEAPIADGIVGFTAA